MFKYDDKLFTHSTHRAEFFFSLLSSVEGITSSKSLMVVCGHSTPSVEYHVKCLFHIYVQKKC